jgi:glucokinase
VRKYAAGVDVGGTFAKVGLVDSNGKVVRSEQFPTEPQKGPKDFVARLKAVLGDWPIASLGVGLAGGVDSKTGKLLFVPNLKGWEGFPFKSVLTKAFNVAVSVDNDANVAVWGGYKIALKGKPRHVVGLTLGTGVGGGLIVDGKLHSGAGGLAGEVGHMSLELDGPACNCGRRGCLEAYAGTYGLQRIARARMSAPPEPLTPKALADAALAGDAGAIAAWEEAGTRLGQGIANLVLILNPDAVLLLGGVARAGRLVLDPVRRVLDAQPFREPFESLTLAAPADRDWGVVGAALLSRERRG